MTIKKKSVYKYAAEAGVPVGLYLSLLSALMIMGVKHPEFSTVSFILLLLFPLCLVWQMRKMGKSEPSYMKFSSLWLCGIYSVIFGTLICMLLTASYIIFLDPGFIRECWLNAIEAIETSPLADNMSATAEMLKSVDSRQLPSVTDYVTGMGWMTCFAGSVISLVLAFIISKTSSKPSSAIG